jgi:hypothetical protein
VRVAVERHILKPNFHLIGARVKTTWLGTRRLSAMGSCGSGGVNVHRPTVHVPAQQQQRGQHVIHLHLPGRSCTGSNVKATFGIHHISVSWVETRRGSTEFNLDVSVERVKIKRAFQRYGSTGYNVYSPCHGWSIKGAHKIPIWAAICPAPPKSSVHCAMRT